MPKKSKAAPAAAAALCPPLPLMSKSAIRALRELLEIPAIVGDATTIEVARRAVRQNDMTEDGGNKSATNTGATRALRHIVDVYDGIEELEWRLNRALQDLTRPLRDEASDEDVDEKDVPFPDNYESDKLAKLHKRDAGRGRR